MFAEDLSAFFSEAEFSVSATLPGGAVVQVIFDEQHQDALGGVFEASGPTALGRASDLSALLHGSTVQLRTRTWRVVGIQPDGTGLTRLILERAP